MRVIAGIARGRRLKELEGRRVLDLFAGTGQLGIEALSRGADSAVFVERRGDAVRLVRENLKETGFTEQARVVQGDAQAFLTGLQEKFDIILLDPPYEAGLLKPVLESIAGFDILSPHGIIVAEHPNGHVLPELQSPYSIYRTYRYGKIGVTVYRRAGEERDEETE